MHLSKFFYSEKFHNLLFELDRDLVLKAKMENCPNCGARLDFANYKRKPSSRFDSGIRFSLCCSHDGCRKRLTTASVRFLGRFHYHATVVVLVAYLLTPNNYRKKRLQKIFGISHQTLKRWEIIWNEKFPSSKLHKLLKAHFFHGKNIFYQMFKVKYQLEEILQIFRGILLNIQGGSQYTQTMFMGSS